MPFIARYECNLLTRVKRFLLLAPAQSPRYTRVDCLPWALRALFTLGPVCDWYPPHVRWPHYKGKVYDRKAFLGGVCVVGMVVPMHYWDPGDRDRFLHLLQGKTDDRGRRYRLQREVGARLTVLHEGSLNPMVDVVGLTPGPPS